MHNCEYAREVCMSQTGGLHFSFVDTVAILVVVMATILVFVWLAPGDWRGMR